ncbi:UNVERIFIED_CONTAM: hypothetical protein ABID98_003562 [Brevibacillus sp. OAP136]
MRTYGNYEKLYKELSRYGASHATVSNVRDLSDIHAIWAFYDKLPAEDLRLIYAAIKKTEVQLGYIPLCFTSVPFIFLVFSSKLANLLEESIPALLCVITILCVVALYLIHRHFTSKAQNALHLHIVEHVLARKQNNPSG